MKIQFTAPVRPALNARKLNSSQQKQGNLNIDQDKFIKNCNISFGLNIRDDYGDDFDFDDWDDGQEIRKEDFFGFPYKIPIETLLSIGDRMYYSNPKNVAETFKNHSARLLSLESGMKELQDESRKMLEAINANKTDINALKKLASKHQATLDKHTENIADLSYFLALNDLRLANLENAVFSKYRKSNKPQIIKLSKEALEVLKSYHPKLTDDDSNITPEKLTEILDDYLPKTEKPIIQLAEEHPELYLEVTKDLPKETRLKFLQENKWNTEYNRRGNIDAGSKTCIAAILIKNKKTPKYLLAAMSGFSPDQIEEILYSDYHFSITRISYMPKSKYYKGTIAGELARFPEVYQSIMEYFPPSERKQFLGLEALIYNRNKDFFDLPDSSITVTTVENALKKYGK